ncbi:modification methylase HhaI [Andreesenia angusta]|uniref:Cytosine-specific methyltransferase n=1 Tax=Andreesenia angusta TaxID=39480 RepID=A0A1S1V4D3_9FIRM|nr:DNA (cytosine-5-)-methyltransferase [Andreesenia angusta]OHW61260.1 modification methylase HhaI [Andreesenia angusta]
MKKRVVELFAGVGGFRVGLEKASEDFEFVWANQWEPSRKSQDAFNCYISHYGESEMHSNEDIESVDKSSIPRHDLLVGGFPCQDYSVARTKAEGIHGKKGVLWWSIYETIEQHEPPFVLLENVDRLLKSPSKQRGRDFGVMLACMDRLGYSVEWRIINAAEYGFPQKRRRTFIFAYKNDTEYAKDLRGKTLEEIVIKEGFFQQEFKASRKDGSDRIGEIEFESEDIPSLSESFKFQFWSSGVMRNGCVYTEELIPFPGDIEFKLLKDVLEKDVPEKYYLNGELDDWEYMKGSKRIERTHKEGHKYTFSEGAIAFPDPTSRPARTMLTSEFSKNRSTHIIKDPQTGRLRKLTPMECERLNGFPDDWTNTGMSERFRYFCMGNALVVGLVEKMGRQIANLK